MDAAESSTSKSHIMKTRLQNTYPVKRDASESTICKPLRACLPYLLTCTIIALNLGLYRMYSNKGITYLCCQATSQNDSQLVWQNEIHTTPTNMTSSHQRREEIHDQTNMTSSYESRMLSFNDNIASFMDNIENIRTKNRTSVSSKGWKPYNRNPKQVTGYDRDYFAKISQHPNLQTVFLEQDITMMKNVLLQEYFQYSSNDCDLVEQISVYGKDFGKDSYNITCVTNLMDMLQGHPLQLKTLSQGFPNGFIQSSGALKNWTFVHIIENGLVDSFGDIRTGDLLIVPQRCQIDDRSNPFKKKDVDHPIYDEVFTIAQFWGEGFYHSTVENLPRIVPYLQFLRRHPHIKIHHHSTSKQFLELLDISHLKERSVSGFVRGRVVYSPAGNPCGRSTLFNTQLLSLHMQQKASSAHPTVQPRNVIVLIKRSTKRYFNNHNKILKILETEAKNYSLEVKVFGDRPVPSTNDTMTMFHRAIMVVAPHGAGESNLLFSQPGTVVIEGLCYDGSQRGNLCYRNLSQMLGLRHHALFYKKTQCMQITAEQIQKPVRFFLKNLSTTLVN